MKEFDNPYTPGAGTPPRELAGRDKEIEEFERLIGRLSRGNSAQSIVLWGLRGVGKTVLLQRFRENAQEAGWVTGKTEGKSDSDLRAELAGMTAEMIRELSPRAKAKDALVRLGRVLRAFSLTLKSDGSVQAQVDIDEALSAVPPDLQRDAVALFRSLGEVAADAGTGAVFFIDEMQALRSTDLEALIAAVHEMSQSTLPGAVVGAGLPSLPGVLTEAKSYSERLFSFSELGSLEESDARQALIRPAETALEDHQVEYASDAVEAVLAYSERYPMFIQMYGQEAWNVADGSPITVEDIEVAHENALKKIDGLFKSRYDRATERERDYMAAMAAIEAEGIPLSSSAVAERAGYKVVSAASVARSELIKKGLIFAAEHGKVAFSIPHFGEYMRRTHHYPADR